MSLCQKHDHFLADILSFIDSYLNCIFVDKIKIMLVITYKISDAFISKGKISVLLLLFLRTLIFLGALSPMFWTSGDPTLLFQILLGC